MGGEAERVEREEWGSGVEEEREGGQGGKDVSNRSQHSDPDRQRRRSLKKKVKTVYTGHALLLEAC